MRSAFKYFAVMCTSFFLVFMSNLFLFYATENTTPPRVLPHTPVIEEGFSYIFAMGITDTGTLCTGYTAHCYYIDGYKQCGEWEPD